MDVTAVDAHSLTSPPRALHKSRSMNGSIHRLSEQGEADAKALAEESSDNFNRVTLTCSERLAAGPVNQWGFRLRLVTYDGRACSRCPWLSGCLGCFIPPNDSPAGIRDGDTVAVDWHMTVMRERYDAAQAMACVNHPSVAAALRSESQPMSLQRCLETFTAEETIPEGYCSRCKELRETNMRMGLWRLPPVLVIQLKRFQYTAYSRRKLRNLVDFPIRGLDLSPFLLNKPGQRPPSHPSSAPTSASSAAEATTATAAAAAAAAAVAAEVAAAAPAAAPAAAAESLAAAVTAAAAQLPPLPQHIEPRHGGSMDSAGDAFTAAGGSSGTGETVGISAATGAGASAAGSDADSDDGGIAAMDVDAAELGDDEDAQGQLHAEPLLPPFAAAAGGEAGGAAQGSDDGSLYDLYAVVHHLGALSAGHYVASVKSQSDGRWHYFNDHQVSEMPENELVSQTAYILFYARRNIGSLKLAEMLGQHLGRKHDAPRSPLRDADIDAFAAQRDGGRCALM
eukprot:TRINITY_DN12329_c0_g1_i2.p1 TRINITY_DN12329_c0_g1~~TRINITY_DN12329_c0_g1_i2.p1  ORF type:complete len:510 (-),score=172.92 TRINITY_DN12329_c0_g1_i2:141-1670(-)